MMHSGVIIPFPHRRRNAAKHGGRALAALHAADAARTRQRLAKRLSRQLAWTHGIRPDETALVPWLTDESCTSNGDALAQWVLRELQKIDPLPTLSGQALLDALSAPLNRRLADVEDTRPW